MQKDKKKNFSSIGFILSAVGAAVGLGNIWGFPTKLMTHGGPAFLVPYLIAILFLGLPLLILEINLGCKWRKAPALFYGKYLGKAGRAFAWGQAGIQLLIGCYYAIIIAWVINTGILSTFDLKSLAKPGYFNENIRGNATAVKKTLNPFGNIQTIVLIGFVFTIFLSVLIVSGGISSGIERVNKVLIPSLFAILGGLFIYVLTLPGAGKGLQLIFNPDFSKLKNGKAWSAAFGQALFTLSLAVTIIIIYSKSAPVGGDNSMRAITIVAGDTLVALMACVIVGAILGYGLDTTENTGGRLFGTMFEDKGNKFVVPGAAVLSDSRDTSIVYLNGLQTTNIASIDTVTNAKAVFKNVATISGSEISKALKLVLNKDAVKFGGSSVIFQAFPQVFNKINNGANFGWGNVLGFILMVAVFFAALSSMISLFEPTVANLEADFKISRKSGVFFAGGVTFLFGFLFAIPSTTGVWDSMNDGFFVSKFLIISAIIEILMLALFWKKLKPILNHNNKNSWLKLGQWFRVVLFGGAALAAGVLIYGIAIVIIEKDALFSAGTFNGEKGWGQTKYLILGLASFLGPWLLMVFGFGVFHKQLKRLIGCKIIEDDLDSMEDEIEEMKATGQINK